MLIKTDVCNCFEPRSKAKQNIMCFIYWTISLALLILMTVAKNGECWYKEELNLQAMLKDWRNISSTWCQADNFPDETIDDVYECFRLSRGNKVSHF